MGQGGGVEHDSKRRDRARRAGHTLLCRRPALGHQRAAPARREVGLHDRPAVAGVGVKLAVRKGAFGKQVSWAGFGIVATDKHMQATLAKNKIVNTMTSIGEFLSMDYIGSMSLSIYVLIFLVLPILKLG